MLTTAEEDRLVDALPLQQTVTYDGSSYAYDVTPYWFRSDAAASGSSTSPQYPALFLEYDPEDDREPERPGLSPFSAYDYKADGTVGVVARTSVRDDLTLTVAVETGTDGSGVPAGVRATQLGRALWRFVRYDLGFDEPGADGERPMAVAVDKPPSRRRTDGRLETEWTARIRYVEEAETTVDTVQDVGYDVTVDD